MTDQHTPAPWHITIGSIYANHNDFVLSVAKMDRSEPMIAATERGANARRIVACVNAFGDYPTSEIEKFTPGTVGKVIADLGDELLALHTRVYIDIRKDSDASLGISDVGSEVGLMKDSAVWLEEHGYDLDKLYRNELNLDEPYVDVSEFVPSDLTQYDADGQVMNPSDRDGAEASFRGWFDDSYDIDWVDLIIKYVEQEELDEANANIAALSGTVTRIDVAEDYLDRWHDAYQDDIADDPDADLSGMESYHDGTDGDSDEPEEVELVHHYATHRLIDSVWTLNYTITDEDNPAIRIYGYDQDNRYGYENEKSLPTCKLIEDSSRTVHYADIGDTRYVVENPQHVFSYSK